MQYRAWGVAICSLDLRYSANRFSVVVKSAGRGDVFRECLSRMVEERRVLLGGGEAGDALRMLQTLGRRNQSCASGPGRDERDVECC